MRVIAEIDKELELIARTHINEFLKETGSRLTNTVNQVLEIGSQNKFGAKECFINSIVESLDLTDEYNPTFVGDITQTNTQIPDHSFECVVCMEVLEHTLDPFAAIREIRRILVDGGWVLLSSPLNFRIHGPIPDCWRFTEHGWKVLLKDFEIEKIDILETPDRFLFPVHYNILAKNNLSLQNSASDIKFRFI